MTVTTHMIIHISSEGKTMTTQETTQKKAPVMKTLKKLAPYAFAGGLTALGTGCATTPEIQSRPESQPAGQSPTEIQVEAPKEQEQSSIALQNTVTTMLQSAIYAYFATQEDTAAGAKPSMPTELLNNLFLPLSRIYKSDQTKVENALSSLQSNLHAPEGASLQAVAEFIVKQGNHAQLHAGNCATETLSGDVVSINYGNVPLKQSACPAIKNDNKATACSNIKKLFDRKSTDTPDASGNYSVVTQIATYNFNGAKLTQDTVNACAPKGTQAMNAEEARIKNLYEAGKPKDTFTNTALTESSEALRKLQKDVDTHWDFQATIGSLPRALQSTKLKAIIPYVTEAIQTVTAGLPAAPSKATRGVFSALEHPTGKLSQDNLQFAKCLTSRLPGAQQIQRNDGTITKLKTAQQECANIPPKSLKIIESEGKNGLCGAYERAKEEKQPSLNLGVIDFGEMVGKVTFTPKTFKADMDAYCAPTPAP